MIKHVFSRDFFGGLVFFLAIALVPIVSLAQTRDVTLTADQLLGLTITLLTPGVYPLDVVVSGPGGITSTVLTITVNAVVSPPILTVEDTSGLIGEPIPLNIQTDADSIVLTIPDSATLSTETSPAPTVGAPEPEVLIEATCGAGQLSGVISQAKAAAEARQSVRVVLPPCIYREQLNISDVHFGSIDVVAEIPGTVIISGADVFTGWLQSGDVWSHAWTLDFGLHWPAGWPSGLPQDEVLKRIETFFVNDIRLTQVAAHADLVDESFFIDEISNKVFIKTPTDLTTALVEGTVRSVAIKISRSENIALRGIREERAASSVQGLEAVKVVSSSNILLEDIVIRDNSGVGLDVSMTEFITTRRVQFLDNGYTGYNTYKVKGLLSEDDTVSGSNWRGFPFGFVRWAPAGFKHLRTHGAVYRRLTATRNLAPGFWLDYDIADVVIEGGQWCDNQFEGGFLEKIQGPLVIRGLIVCDNGTSGVMASAARNITIENSEFRNNGSSQIHFRDDGALDVTDFETGEQFSLSTDLWTMTNNSLSALGTQTILSGGRGILPEPARDNPLPNFTASGNICSTENPTVPDARVCR